MNAAFPVLFSLVASTYPEVATFANLPNPVTNPGFIYLVRSGSGVVFVNRKPAGLYRSDGVEWLRLDEESDAYFADTLAWSKITGKPSFFDGAYASLTGKPALFDGAYESLTGKPALFDGAYASLTGKPTLGTAAAAAATSFATAAQGNKADTALQPSGNGSGLTGLTKAQVGLSAVDNTADADKPVSTAQATALNGKQDTLISGTTLKTVGGASLLGAGNIPLTASAAWGSITGTLSAQADLQAALDAKGTSNFDGAYSSLTGRPTLFDGAYSSLTGKPTLGTAAAAATTDFATATQGAKADSALQPAGNGGSLTGLTKAQVGLGSVDNTSDASKPISTATQTALDAKQATLVSGMNIKTVNGNSLVGAGDVAISASAAWGGITGTLSAQTDLQNALNAKAATSHTHTPTFPNGQLVGRAATPATTGTMTVPMDTAVKTITPTGACTFNASGGVEGQIVTFYITTSGTTSYTLTFGTNFRKTGTLATGTTTARAFCVSFRCIDGTVWAEMGRTAAQT